MALAHCILGSFLGVGCHYFPPPLDVPTFASRCLHVQVTWETSISEKTELRARNGRSILPVISTSTFFDKPRKSATWEMALLPPQGRHAVDFFARKIRRLRPGSNPRSWVPEASMLTTRPPKPPVRNYWLEKLHWSRCILRILLTRIIWRTCWKPIYITDRRSINPHTWGFYISPGGTGLDLKRSLILFSLLSYRNVQHTDVARLTR